jgi:MOSC domain-containing protein YiiM
MSALVVALFVCRAHREPLVSMTRVEALAGRGLEGDLHAKPGSHRQVLLAEQEVLERFGLAPGEIREQVTVRGLDLKGLTPGSRLRIGTAVLEVGGLCAPCDFIERLQPGLLARIGADRGRFVSVVTAGGFAVGDAIVAEGVPA